MYIADLHIHSKYSRATSATCDLAHLDLWARRKGIALVGTGDFTHPAWRQELSERLEPAEDGLYRFKPAFRLPDPAPPLPDPRFVLTGEISCIYKRDGKVRKVHNLILLPRLEDAERLSEKLAAIGNTHSDGRPILGLDSRDLLEITLDACPDAMLIPAHIWTPHFSMFGAFSGFDTVEECFGDLASHIHAVETGLSSDPPMNWRVPLLDGLTLISNSDAHSPAKLGREANLLNGPLSYPGLKRALETGEGFCGTVEFFPEEGKYHLDGHRNCALRITPEETRAYGGKCPVCGKKITVGVLNRVEQLARRPEGYEPSSAKPFEHLMPLEEVVGASLGISSAGNKAQLLYYEMLHKLGPEFHILRSAPLEDVRRAAGEAVAEGLARLRAGKVQRLAGYDGEYGKISLFTPRELELAKGQLTFLTDAPRPREEKKPAPVPPPEPAPIVAPKPHKAGENAEQQAAVRSERAEVAVLAGPGTGKTRTLVERAAYLVTSGRALPEEITAVTFTNQAARELRERLNAKLGGSADRMAIGTFHAICMDLLKDADLTLIDRAEALSLAAEVLSSLGLKTKPKKFLQNVSAMKNRVEGAEVPEEAYHAYNERLKKLRALDFDDLIAEAVRRGFSGDSRFKHLLVDEFQDVNAVQYELISDWHRGGETLFVIGDPDQSIYGFRGAAANCFDKLLSDYPATERIRLLRNYRSTPEVVTCGLSVISHNPGEPRTLQPERAHGKPARLVAADTDLSEAIFIAKEIARMTGGLDMLEAASGPDAPPRAFSDIAVLCRTNRRLELIESCLRRDGIPCTVTCREDYLEEPEVRGTLGFFRSLLSPDAPSLRAALHLMFSLPQEQAAEAAEEVVPNAWENAEYLERFPALLPWAEQARAYRSAPAQPPREALEKWAGARGIDTPAYGKLLKAGALYPTLADLLNALLYGAEGDVRRGDKPAFAADAVRLTTLHGAKGLEFPVVFLSGLSEGVLPLTSSRTETDPEEERRLFFVGITRARDELILTAPGTRSPFLSELPRECLLTEHAGPPKDEGRQLSLF